MERCSAWSGMSPACVVPRINKRLRLWLRWLWGRGEVTIFCWSDAMRYLGPELGLAPVLVSFLGHGEWGSKAGRNGAPSLHPSLNITSSPLYLTFSQEQGTSLEVSIWTDNFIYICFDNWMLFRIIKISETGSNHHCSFVFCDSELGEYSFLLVW